MGAISTLATKTFWARDRFVLRKTADNKDKGGPRYNDLDNDLALPHV